MQQEEWLISINLLVGFGFRLVGVFYNDSALERSAHFHLMFCVYLNEHNSSFIHFRHLCVYDVKKVLI